MFIGVSGYNHESSAALVDKNGVLVDFYREESLSRIKGDKSFPRRSIKKLLVANNLKIEDIERNATKPSDAINSALDNFWEKQDGSNDPSKQKELL